MRGLRHHIAGIQRHIGITPACAGTTACLVTIFAVHRDHPRVCGDYGIVAGYQNTCRGSPPRVRGLLCGNSQWQWSGRITPACAGTTQQGSRPASRIRDHPRVCGDYAEVFGRKSISLGSPPRVRGLPVETAKGVEIARITPACAGTTRSALYWFLPLRDHPRVCGDYSLHGILQSLAMGSPPRVRGLPNSAGWPGALLGITPACAGTTRPVY